MDEYSVVRGLSEEEIASLAECEGVIRRGIKTFVEVGNALLTIRAQRLYREQFKTFEAYCRERWSISKPHGTRLIQAAQVVQDLVPMGTKPESERQARPLTKLPPIEQAEAWKAANEKAESEGRKATAKDVEEAVRDSESGGRGKTSDRVTLANGLQYARMAIAQLEKIDAGDAEREQAFNVVTQWIGDHQ